MTAVLPWLFVLAALGLGYGLGWRAGRARGAAVVAAACAFHAAWLALDGEPGAMQAARTRLLDVTEAYVGEGP